MTLEIPDQILHVAGRSENDLRLLLALFLFQEEIFTLGQASKFAGLHIIQFQRELAKRKIPLHYGNEEYRQDMETIAKIA